MYLCYIDETEREQFYGLAAVVVNAEDVIHLTAKATACMEQICSIFGLPRDTEFHAHPAFQGKGVWKKVGSRARVKVFQDLVEAVCGCQARVILRGVDRRHLLAYQERKGYPEKFSAEVVALQHLLQRINGFVQTQGSHALLIADERSDSSDQRLKFAEYQRYGTPGYYLGQPMERIVDTIHYAPSHASRMIQLADLFAFLFQRWHFAETVVSDSREVAILADLMSQARSRGTFYHYGVWPPGEAT
ncbi:MAG: DUF3800 domain-containing protein [Cumulibacter sp.]